MKKIKKYLFLFMLSTIVFVAKGQYINDFVVDSANHKIYVAGSFYTYKGESRQHLAAIDSKTGKLLPWHPVIPSLVSPAITMDNNIIYAAGETRSDGYISAIDTNGNVISSLRANIKTIGYVACMTINNNLIYLSGGFELISGEVVNTIILDKQGDLISSDEKFSKRIFKKILFTNSRICALSDTVFYIYDRQRVLLDSFNLKTEPTANWKNLTGAFDFLIDDDTAFITGVFPKGNGFEGGKKYNVETLQEFDWNFSLNGAGSIVPISPRDPACLTYDLPYYPAARSIAKHNNSFLTGGVIGMCDNAGCVKFEDPLEVDRFKNVLRIESKKLFDTDTNKRVRKYKITDDVLYYITSVEVCEGPNGDQYVRRDKIGAYCLQPEMPGEFINSEDYPCIGQDYLYEVKESVPGRKYNWSCNVAGAKITPNGNKAIINFPYFKLEHIVSVTVVNECGVESPDRTMTVLGSVRPPVVYVSGEDKTLTCTRTSFPMKAIANESPVNYVWTYPDGSKSTTPEITVNTPGTYQVDVLNTSTGCSISEPIIVNMDTVKPVVKNPLTYTITSCNPYSVKATGVSDSITDEITWNVNGTITPNPIEFTQTGTYIESVKRVKNGCVTNATVKVTSNTPQPSIIPPVTAVKDGNGNVIMDTLTCIKNSVLMNFTSDVAQYKIELKQPAPLTDTLPNNSTVATPGFYTVYIKDLNTLCKGNPLLVEVKSDKTPPYLALPGTVPTINCSFSEALLDGQSATPGAQLVWTGSGGFSSADPATVTKPGEYILTVTDPHNGCIKKDTLEVIKENSLVLKGQADTIICIGSEIELTTKPVGGTPAFTYAWSTVAGNNESIKVKPTTTTTYSVTVIDAVNCVGKDTIIVKVPSAIHDSTITFAPCDPASINGQIQIFASGGIPPYMYSNDKGITYQNSQIFSNLAFGTYQLSVKDSLGCTHDFSKSIDAQSQKPTSDFIINTTMMAKDTFVVVDISNPRPDTIIWKFPATVKVVNTNFYAPIIVSSDTGAVEVIMETHFGTCVSNLTKKVNFIKKDTTISPVKGNGIEELNIFPNPNTGAFTVEIKLFKKQRLAIYVFDAKGVEQTRVIEPVVDYSSNNIVLPVKNPGTYVLKVIAEYDSKARTFIVTQ